jgi:23S rRNA (cytidine1920-2'-O)/16S rRNA (cytidine1409-2'-O)-methyltransferase
MRADQLLVSRGIATSRSQAQRVLAAGGVVCCVGGVWKPLVKGADLALDTPLRLTDTQELKYVSRGGLKLEAALLRSGINPSGQTVLDVGQSTGGFTDCLLKGGAQRVVGVDVGHGQLAPALKNNSQVVCLEGINARQLTAKILGEHMPNTGFDLIVGDVSFISMALVLPQLPALLRPDGQLLCLIKPQFELQPQLIGRGGIVRDPAHYGVVEQRIRNACAECGFVVHGFFASSITGGDGNHEFFLHARLASQLTSQGAAHHV